MNIAIIALIVLQIALSSAGIWSAAVLIIGNLRGRRKLPKQFEKLHRFAVVICAHNEQEVVSNLLESLENQVYPKQNWHAFVIADRCSDDTAKIAAQFPFVTVMPAPEDGGNGKGRLLKWGFAQILESQPGGFDCFMLFDADNTAAPDFMSRMNDALCTGADLVTGNRFTSNQNETIISRWYSVYWNMINFVYNRPRDNLRLSPLLSGTGFAFRCELVENGWHTVSMTEDIEFSLQQGLLDKRIAFADDCVFYDEQPVDFKVMIRQIHRWCTGDYQIGKHYFADWLKAFFKAPSARLLDLFTAIPLCTNLSVMFLTGIVLQMLLYQVNPIYCVAGLAGTLIVGYLVSLAIGLVAVIGNSGGVKGLETAILSYPIFLGVLTLVSAYTLFRPLKTWKKIDHFGKKPKNSAKSPLS